MYFGSFFPICFYCQIYFIPLNIYIYYFRDCYFDCFEWYSWRRKSFDIVLCPFQSVCLFMFAVEFMPQVIVRPEPIYSCTCNEILPYALTTETFYDRPFLRHFINVYVHVFSFISRLSYYKYFTSTFFSQKFYSQSVM